MLYGNYGRKRNDDDTSKGKYASIVKCIEIINKKERKIKVENVKLKVEEKLKMRKKNLKLKEQAKLRKSNP